MFVCSAMAVAQWRNPYCFRLAVDDAVPPDAFVVHLFSYERAQSLTTLLSLWSISMFNWPTSCDLRRKSHVSRPVPRRIESKHDSHVDISSLAWLLFPHPVAVSEASNALLQLPLRPSLQTSYRFCSHRHNAAL